MISQNIKETNKYENTLYNNSAEISVCTEFEKVHKYFSDVDSEVVDTKKKDFKEKAFALNFVSDPVFQYDKNYKIVWANKAALELSGFSLKQIIGKSCAENYPGISCNAKKCPVKEAFESFQQCSAVIHTHDAKWFSVNSLPFINDSGVECVIEIIRDETHKRNMDNLLISDFDKVVDFADKLSLLTSREYEIMTLVVEGKSNKNISLGLNISSKTVEIHRARVMNKIKIESLAELVRLFTLYEFYNNNIPSVFQK